jgi:plasmid stabilization system protein ParE
VSLIIFTTPAKFDLGQIFEHIAQDNVELAIKHRQRLQKRWMALVEQPRIGTKRVTSNQACVA